MTSSLSLNITQLTRNVLTSIATLQATISTDNYEMSHANRKLQDVNCITAIRNGYNACSASPQSLACITEIDSSTDICIKGALSPYCQEKLTGMIISDCNNFTEFNQTLHYGLIKEENYCPNLRCGISIIKVEFCKFVSESEINCFESRIEETMENLCFGQLSTDSPVEKPTHSPSATPTRLPSLNPSLNPTLKPSESPSQRSATDNPTSLAPTTVTPTSEPSVKQSSSAQQVEVNEWALAGAAIAIAGANLI